MRLTKTIQVSCLIAWLAGIAACATPLPSHDQAPSHAVEPPRDGLFASYMHRQPAERDAASGFFMLDRGVDALAARLQLIDAASASLDLQYYIYKSDVTGGLIAERLLAAADRGVRVRILLDDVGNSLKDSTLAALDGHDNIELRLFNPVSVRNRWLNLVSQVVEFGRINNRMHNKVLVADNQAMITGGRNIGDEYYALSEQDFQDIDLLGIGPISQDASRSFDAFWNSPSSIPMNVVHGDTQPVELENLRSNLVSHRRRLAQQPYHQAMEKLAFSQSLGAGSLRLYWGEADWLADPPSKASAGSPNKEDPHLARILADHTQQLESELLMKSAYFIPRERGVESLGALVERGVEVSVLTNSLATTDVLAVHSSYAPYRKPLLQSGVRLWELQPINTRQPNPNTFVSDSVASLHAKSFVFDRRKLFVGSINVDPRSIVLNTEAGVMVYQPELAQQMARVFQRWTAQGHAFELRLNEDDAIEWRSGEKRWTTEPEAGRGRRFIAWLIDWLPIEDQL